MAPLEYPQYRWYGQTRPIRDYRKDVGHVHEDDPQKELANLMTDAMAISHCQALIGQGDGSITLFYHVFGCNQNPTARCPAYFDLQTLTKKGYMPYIGARHDETTYATFNMR